MDERTRRALPLTLLLGVAMMAGCDRLPGSDSSRDDPPEARGAELDSSQVARLPAGTTAEMAELGSTLYPSCAVCHGFEGEGTQLGPDLHGADWIHITGGVDEIAWIIRSGVADPEDFPVPMPPMGGADLDDEQIRALATYVYLLGDEPSSSDPTMPTSSDAPTPATP
jgi:mono/diheme cytochrome c family protein